MPTREIMGGRESENRLLIIPLKKSLFCKLSRLFRQRFLERDFPVPGDDRKLLIRFFRFGDQLDLASCCFDEQNTGSNVPNGNNALYVGIKAPGSNVDLSPVRQNRYCAPCEPYWQFPGSVRYPPSRAMDSIIAQVDPLPFVPAT